ncbi:hypothetical protein Q1695_005285 [Nippostrongylus brasiliensis]|nr:hypothetical protein Q1695_005285 [Nippostrongylus brasiliensis]
MAAFVPVPAVFVCSQQRGPDVALYALPNDHELCYEWSFKRLLADRATKTYICCGCRALKDALPGTYRSPIPYCRIRSGNFITDPANPVNPHFCEPRSNPRARMRRVVLRKCNELRQSHSRRPTSVVVQELVQEVAGPEFDDYSAPERRAMIEHLTCPSVSDSGNLNRVIRYNIRRGQADVIPGALADGRFKQIPPEMNPTRSSQLYTIIGEFDLGHTFPLLYAFLPDATEETYLNLFRWFRDQIEPLGGVAALEANQCNFITDYEMSAINAVRSTLNVNHYGCLFHYIQAIQRNRDHHQLRKAFKTNAAVAMFFRRLQVLPLLDPRFRAVSQALMHPVQPVVTADEETKLRSFMNYWYDTWGIAGRFGSFCCHAGNYGARTTNLVEGFHNKLRSFCPNRAPSLAELLQFLGCEITLAKSRIIPLRQGQLGPREVRADERRRQEEVLNELQRFHRLVNMRPPTTRECKDHLDTLAILMTNWN